MTDEFPSAPPTPPTLESRPPVEPAAWRGAVVAIGFVVLLAVIVGSLFTFLRVEPAVKAVPSPAPSEAPSSTPTVVTLEALQKKMQVVAFYLGRGQEFGATQVLKDFLGDSGCIVLYRGYQAFSTRKAAEEVNTQFRTQARPSFPGALLATGLVKADNPKIVGGRWMAVGVAVDCP